MKVLVCATTTEATLCARIWRHPSRISWKKRKDYLLYLGQLQHPFAIVVTGMGLHRARKGLEMALLELENVESVIGFGFAGALCKSSQPGDLVLPSTVFFDQSVEKPTSWLFQDLALCASSNFLHSLVSVNHVVASPAEKAALHVATEALAVDMESAAWGVLCQAKHIPWAVVRSILDTSDEHIFKGLSRMVDPVGRIRWLVLFASIVFQPTLWAVLYRYRRFVVEKAATPMAQLLLRWLQASRKPQCEEG